MKISHSLKARATEGVDSDGSSDSITILTYDDDGNLLTESDDYNGDGNAGEISTYTYVAFMPIPAVS